MIVRAIDGNNDWLFGKGKSDYNYDLLAVAQNIKTRVQSFLGDCFFDENAGIDWWNLLGSKRLLDLRLALATTILNTESVNGLVELTVALDKDRRVQLTYAVTTVYGPIKRSELVGIPNA